MPYRAKYDLSNVNEIRIALRKITAMVMTTDYPCGVHTSSNTVFVGLCVYEGNDVSWSGV